MNDLKTAAQNLAAYLNTHGTSEPDWYRVALWQAGADDFFDEELTDAADGSNASDIFILRDGDQVIRVTHDHPAEEWVVL